jgi:peptidyl-prolyl cis-trans isomerase SurA
VFEDELAHILFSTSNGGKDEARKRAESVKAKLDQGGSFEALAAQHSEDPEFSQGGLFGTVKVGEIVPQLERALSSVRPGEITGIIEMPDGLHIFKVLKRRLVPSPDFERAKNAIADKLFGEAFKRQYFLWIEGLRTSSYIKINK